MHSTKPRQKRLRAPQPVEDRAPRSSRRSLLRWGLFSGAALGLPRWKVLEVLERNHGRAFAQEAACVPANRSVHIVGGRGGAAWFQCLWPHNGYVQSQPSNAAFHRDPGDLRELSFEGGARRLTVSPDTPWQNLPRAKQVTALVAGSADDIHSYSPTSGLRLASGDSALAAVAAIQRKMPAVIPALAINNLPLSNLGNVYGAGTVQGAPALTEVPRANTIAGVFSSSASQELLRQGEDHRLYEQAYVDALALRSAAQRSIPLQHGSRSGRLAAAMLGRDLGRELAITDQDRARYGYAGVAENNVRGLGDALVVTAKLFRLQLSTSVTIQALYDDPHSAFRDNRARETTRNRVALLGTMLDAFMADLAATPLDGCTGGSTLADATVVSFHGDTFKNPRLVRGGDDWPDAMPEGANLVYILGQGYLKPGWFGGIDAERSVTQVDLASGETYARAGAADATRNETEFGAATALVHAVAKGDGQIVRNFTTTDIAALANGPTG